MPVVIKFGPSDYGTLCEKFSCFRLNGNVAENLIKVGLVADIGDTREILGTYEFDA